MDENKVANWPISKHLKMTSDWVYVETFYGTYNNALKRALELQESEDSQWQYRIWDCR